MTFYDRIALFKAADETDYRFARRIGISYGTLAMWRGGTVPTLIMVVRVAERLGADPAQIAFGTTCEKTKP